MAVIVRIAVNAALRDAHDRLGAAVEARIDEQGGPPDGLMVHLGWPEGDGFVIAEAWRTEELFHAYLEQVIEPALTELGLTAGEPEISPAWSIARP